jgi:hypothetical protein
MAIPYRKATRSIDEGCVAYLDVLHMPAQHTFYGALFLIDGKGRPLEFVHNVLAAPSGFLWDSARVRALGIAMLTHSLFEACRREPDLLICRDTLGSIEFCREEIAPAIPFAQVKPMPEGIPAEWHWVNDPPGPGMRAHTLFETLRVHGMLLEPFQRITQGLREIYPDAMGGSE